MKKRFFTIFACIVMGCTAIPAFAAPKSNNVALDMVRMTFDDGRVARIYTVKKGTDVREGVALSYHPNGKLAVEAPYRDGKLDGVLRSYDENGMPLETVGYMDGEEEGFSIIYYQNGKNEMGFLAEDMNFVRGIRNGLYHRYTFGKVTLEAEFQNNRCVKNCNF